MDLPICRDECPIQEIKPIQLLGMRLLGMRLFWIDSGRSALTLHVRVQKLGTQSIITGDPPYRAKAPWCLHGISGRHRWRAGVHASR
jgi:hypothetical protein